MSKRKTVILWSFVVALIILLVGATGIAHNAKHSDEPVPTITASPDVTLENPEPEITAASDVKLDEPEPTVESAPAPIYQAPSNIPPQFFPSTPQYQSPYTGSQVPLPAPQQPPVGPNVPSPVQPLPPVVTGPVEGLLEPLKPITDPLLGTVKDTLPPLPSLPKVDIHVGLHP